MELIIEKVAQQYDIDPAKCRAEIEAALQNAGVNLNPEEVILLSVARILTLLVPEVPTAGAAGGIED